MTADEFRTLALSFPEAAESAHMDHPDFRVKGKIFATLGPNDDWAMVKLTPAQQQAFVERQPAMFQPFPGAWGARGCTKVSLHAAIESAVRPALVAAWRNTAPKRLVRRFEEEEP